MSNDADVPQNVTCHVSDGLNSAEGSSGSLKLFCYGMGLKIIG